MHLVQFLILEVGPECNYGGIHPKCPTGDQRRWSSLPVVDHLNEEMMVKVATRLFAEFHFRGLVGFHYLNEPLLYRDAMARVIEGIKRHVPHAGFVLWTNGSMIQTREDADYIVEHFEQVYVTEYDKRDLRALLEKSKHLFMLRVHFDKRRGQLMQISDERCLRMYTEFIVDYHGNVHICCMDWQGKASPGNIFAEELGVLVRRFQEIRGCNSETTMNQGSPLVCRQCGCRLGRVDKFVPEIARDATAETMVGKGKLPRYMGGVFL